MAKLSISGAGIMGRPGVAARLFDTLARCGINLRLIATSEVKLSCLVEGSQGQRALRAAAAATVAPRANTAVSCRLMLPS